jgi:hypothetical protein
MKAKPMMMLAFLAMAACSAQKPPLAHTAAAAPTQRPAAPPVSPAEPELPPSASLGEADRLYQSQLAASRGQFEIDRQVSELRRAKLLYEQFIEHAANRPELEPAVRKSRERIVDVQQTIDFLEGSPQSDAATTR